MMAWAVIPAVAYMAYILQTDGELYMPTRRPWGARIISWEKEPVGFLFGGLQVYGIFLVAMVMAQMMWGIAGVVLGSLWQWARRRWIRWAQWKPWRQWWWWPGGRR